MDKNIAAKIDDFFKSYAVRTDQAGQVLAHAGEDLPGVIHLIKGQISQYDISPKGEKIVVNAYKPPAFFPMSWAINHTPNQYFFEAVEAIEYRLAPPEDVVTFLKDNPDVTFNLLSRVYAGTDGLLRRMAHLMGGNARSRVLFEVLVEARRFGTRNQDNTYVVKMSQSELANRSGLSRETISRALQDLGDLISIGRNSITVKDLGSLETELGSEL